MPQEMGMAPSTTLPGEWGPGRGREPMGDGATSWLGSPLLIRVPGDSLGRAGVQGRARLLEYKL